MLNNAGSPGEVTFLSDPCNCRLRKRDEAHSYPKLLSKLELLLIFASHLWFYKEQLANNHLVKNIWVKPYSWFYPKAINLAKVTLVLSLFKFEIYALATDKTGGKRGKKL